MTRVPKREASKATVAGVLLVGLSGLVSPCSREKREHVDQHITTSPRSDGSRRFVFQGVHMLFDGQPDRQWGDAPAAISSSSSDATSMSRAYGRGSKHV